MELAAASEDISPPTIQTQNPFRGKGNCRARRVRRVKPHFTVFGQPLLFYQP
jgi:hypothetical protein